MQNNTLITQEEMLKIPAEEISDPSWLNHTPLVSVVMMTRNHQDYIRQAVESVINQEVNFPIEILIGEDFSTDNTRQECENLQLEYPHLIRLIVATENVGITPNFLRLVSRARGKYIALLEGDDYWIHPQKLSLQVELMETHPEYSWCGGKTINRTFPCIVKSYYTFEETLERYIIHTSSVLFKHNVLNVYPNFPNIVGWISFVYIYLSQHGNCGFLNEELSFYRKHIGGLYTGKNAIEHMRLSHLFTDVSRDYLNNDRKYLHHLLKRELWICSMETEIKIENYGMKVWFDNIRILCLEVRRLIKIIPLEFIAFSIKIFAQPLIFLYFYTRRKLALRSRLVSLVNYLKV